MFKKLQTHIFYLTFTVFVYLFFEVGSHIAQANLKLSVKPWVPSPAL